MSETEIWILNKTLEFSMYFQFIYQVCQQNSLSLSLCGLSKMAAYLESFAEKNQRRILFLLSFDLIFSLSPFVIIMMAIMFRNIQADLVSISGLYQSLKK